MKNIVKNKKGFTAQSFMVAMAIFTSCIALFVLMISSATNDYDKTSLVDDEFSDTFDKSSETTDNIGDMYSALSGEGGLSLFDAADLFFTAGFSVITLIFSSITTAGSLLFNFPTYFGMNKTASFIMMTLISSILLVYVTYTIINSLRGNKL